MIRTFTTSKTVDLQATKADLDFVNAQLDLKAPLANPTFTGYGRFSDNLIAGDPGTEGTSINIGGVAYESTLKVSDIDGTKYAQTILHRHSTTLEPLIVGARSNSNTSAHAAVTAGQGLFTIFAAGFANTFYNLFGSLTFQVGTGTVSDASAPGKLVLSVTPEGAVLPVAAMTIDSDGIAAFTASPTGPTPTPGDSSTKIATTAFVGSAISTAVPMSSPNLLAFAAAHG